MDEMPEPGDDAPEILKTAKEQGLGVYGLYCPARDGAPASIILFVQDIYRGIPSYWWWSPILTLRINRTLAHEVGHHLDAMQGFVFNPGDADEDKEAIANRYAEHVLSRMLKRWHYRLARWKLKNIAMAHYVGGMRAWKGKRYKEAAKHWYKAWDLDPELKDAAYWYWRAKELFDNHSPTRS